MWDDYCPAPPFDLGIDEPAGITGEEGKAAEDKGVANAAATGDIEWGIDWGNMDFDEVVQGAVKNDVVQSAGHMSPAAFSTPTEVAKTTAEGESSGKGAASSSEEPVPEKRERRIQKAPPSQRSPYVNVEMRKDFTCNAETNRVYALILLLGGGGGTRRTSQGDDTMCVFLLVATSSCFFFFCMQEIQVEFIGGGPWHQAPVGLRHRQVIYSWIV